MAAGAIAFKQWLDNLFLTKGIEGNLVRDHHGLRFYGLYDQMKNDWLPLSVGITQQDHRRVRAPTPDHNVFFCFNSV